MAPPLELIARVFACERSIPLTERRIGFIGRHGSLGIMYTNKGKKQRFSLKKNFPALEKSYESALSFTDTDDILHIHVLYGCLPDYVTLLDNVENQFCENVRKALSGYLWDEKIKPESMVKEEIAPVNYVGMALLLDYFYPIN